MVDLSEQYFLNDLRKIDLSHNRITNLGFLENFTSLKELILDGNKIEEISSLGHLKKLKVLSLKNNLLGNIYSVINTCLECPKLQKLNLKKNPLSRDYYYKYQVILRVLNLKQLDEDVVLDVDREMAVQFQRHFGSQSKIQG